MDVKKKLMKLAVKRGFRAKIVYSFYSWLKDMITSKVFDTKNLLVNDTVKFKIKIFASLFADFVTEKFCLSTVLTRHGRGTLSNKYRDFFNDKLTSLTAEKK